MAKNRPKVKPTIDGLVTKPLTDAEVRTRVDEHQFINGIVKVNLADAINNDREGWLDVLAEALVASPELLESISYLLVGHHDNVLFVRVTGDASMILNLTTAAPADGAE